MTRLTWGEMEKRPFEFGVDRVVFYPKNGRGYSWSGVVSIKETTPDASQSLIYIDGVGHENQLLIGNFAASIDAMTYPDEFEPYDGYSDIYSGQTRAGFDLAYRSMQDGDHYKIHLVYNVKATPSSRNNSSINTTTDVELFSWELSTRPELVPDAKASSHFLIDTKQVNPGMIEAIENRLYGTSGANPDMPTITELLALFEEYAIFIVIDNGDGTATITGPDEAVYADGVDPTLWTLDWPSVTQQSLYTYKATSR